MAERAPKRSFWLNIETIIIVVFFLFFILWAMRKCNDETHLRQAGDDKYRQQHIKDSIARVQRITAPIPTQVPATVTSTTSVATPAPQPTAPTTTVTQPTATATPTTPSNNASQQMLWVIIEGLNVREKPTLKSKSYGKLSLHDRVSFLGDVTKDSQKLSLGSEEANEPWVKIKTKRGTIGWVYGAGVSFYKTKRKGVF